ncbi:putative opt family small oligopeptide transporter protein [Phaeoacremonium minimum UCRPA7]|uniref:Putative opt family small oligopeptide transporter protein n=1 Tax=Phaeoacremonium minimum (strain UCR-PA7) TaxID=1286976 RepID=R8BYL8_PHAM7|nr:putative opt family small oligopeptide transporter protein [Phaeoacremonium minimum UCRPA7]EOO04458.1 putative opt family small oligopeptide transporter protein [Phaeoacremonium minimum UCRPA7]
MDTPPSEKLSGTTSRVRIADDDRDWDPKIDAEASGLEATPGHAVSRFDDPVPSGRRLSPVEDLKRRLSEWGESSVHRGLDEEEEGSEYELLLDPNLPDEYSSRLQSFDRDSASFDDEVALKRTEEGEDSPYPEVRAAVRNYDEDVPCNTVRAWTIGLVLVCVGASMNTLFSLRSPSIGLGALIAQIIAWPIGHGWARIMPKRRFNFFGLRWSLNPGPFNIKEHSIIVVMASVSFSVAYATDIILAQKVFYKQDFGIPFQLMLTISTQSLGYGIAGIMRKFLGKIRYLKVSTLD